MEAVTNYTKAGGGCGSCQEDIAGILSRIRGEPVEVVAPPKPKKPRLTNIQKIRLIQETIDREIRPRLRQDG